MDPSGHKPLGGAVDTCSVEVYGSITRRISRGVAGSSGAYLLGNRRSQIAEDDPHPVINGDGPGQRGEGWAGGNRLNWIRPSRQKSQIVRPSAKAIPDIVQGGILIRKLRVVGILRERELDDVFAACRPYDYLGSGVPAGINVENRSCSVVAYTNS